jgi:hypothetical protein
MLRRLGKGELGQEIHFTAAPGTRSSQRVLNELCGLSAEITEETVLILKVFQQANFEPQTSNLEQT